jgi:ankyrin repeat protein
MEKNDNYRPMIHLLITTIAAVLLVGCGESQSPEPPIAKAPDISIHKAATFGNIEAVKQHLAAGTDVNAKDDNGFPPLHLAADRGHTEVVELLITKGAEVNAQSDGGNTPLDWAVDSAHSDKETADLLRKHGGKN